MASMTAADRAPIDAVPVTGRADVHPEGDAVPRPGCAHVHSDGELLRRATLGHEDAWHELMARYGGLVLRIARRSGLSSTDAADAAQLTWLRLFQKAGSIRAPERLRWWLATTARRESVRLAARAAREPLDPDPAVREPAPPADSGIFDDYLDEDLLHAMQSLPPRYRALLELLVSDERLSYGEIAARLSIPIGSIGPMRGRCLKLLKQSLQRRGGPSLGAVAETNVGA
jgi:RNA polymerase sigma factor (sigma-70 family)